ncbi:MAG: A/G-specific adenine glycosylase [Proteobacteria bacterium]|nr:A/G-specific adenine glycosylase [Pseudomonadota bacterium]
MSRDGPPAPTPGVTRCTEITDFADRLIVWQRRHGRHDLPWQQTRDPYRIWLSEIMLQQTQVTTVIPYYARFLARFPDLAALAAAPLEAVLEHWAGLGYYARARNLHRCAQTLVATHGGRFPESPEAIAELPGIGRSTAAAIAAFAFGARAAILDGNVKRVLARHFGIERWPGETQTERALWTLAESLLPARDIAAYTQGLMDLGATVCTRRRPRCDDCPLHAGCLARTQGRQEALPVSRPRKPLPLRRTGMFLLTDGERVLLERRPPSGIWGGLLSLPEADSATPEAAQALARRHGCELLETRPLPPLRHTFTHFQLDIDALRCTVRRDGAPAADANAHWLPLATALAAGLPAPVGKLLTAA